MKFLPLFKFQEDIYETYPVGVRFGDVAVTDGYRLKCNKIYHGALPEWDRNKAAVAKKVHVTKAKPGFTQLCIKVYPRLRYCLTFNFTSTNFFLRAYYHVGAKTD